MEAHRHLALRRLVRVVTLILALSWAAEGAAADAPPGSILEEQSQLGDVEPRFQSSIRSRVRHKLLAGSLLALHWIVRNPSCRELFEGLEAGGVQALRRSIYVAARPGIERSICDRDVVAFTEVGSSVTRLCPGFGRLPNRHAAVVLIHEALHSTGLREKPMDPEGLTSDQITRLVTRDCAARSLQAPLQIPRPPKPPSSAPAPWQTRG